jgi:hypothetical protein
MGSIISALMPVALELVGYFLRKSANNEEMAKLFFKWIEKIQDEYLMSAKNRDFAKERLKAISEKPFIESP